MARGGAVLAPITQWSTFSMRRRVLRYLRPVVLAGGGLRQKNLDRRIGVETGLLVLIADDPLQPVVTGTEASAIRPRLHKAKRTGIGRIDSASTSSWNVAAREADGGEPGSQAAMPRECERQKGWRRAMPICSRSTAIGGKCAVPVVLRSSEFARSTATRCNWVYTFGNLKQREPWAWFLNR